MSPVRQRPRPFEAAQFVDRRSSAAPHRENAEGRHPPLPPKGGPEVGPPLAPRRISIICAPIDAGWHCCRRRRDARGKIPCVGFS